MEPNAFDYADLPRRVAHALAEGAIVVIGPKGVTEAELKNTLFEATSGLKRDGERRRVYLMIDHEVNR